MNHVIGYLLLVSLFTPTSSTGNATSASSSAYTTQGVKNGSQLVVHGVTCSEQCSEQELNYCTGFGYPLIDEEMRISCNTRDQQGRDRYLPSYIDSAIAGRWKNVTVIFQELLLRKSPSQERFPPEYFEPDAALLSVLEGHKMSNSCNAHYLPLKELICSWMYVSPCDPEFKICQEACDELMETCFPTAVRGYPAREILNFVCSVLSNNGNSTDCHKPEDVYSEEYTDRRRSGDGREGLITIISVSSGVVLLILAVVFVLAALRYYLGIQGFVPDDMIKLDILDPIFEKGIVLFGKSKYSSQLRAGSRVIGETLRRGKKEAVPAAADLDAYDLHSLNSSASTFYCQTDQSISTIAEVLPPETIYFESVLSSRWKSSEDEVVALVSWIDGIGNKKKGVIKCYTDKRRRQMESELGVISQLSHENVCEYLWRSMSTRPLVRSMSPHLQSVMSLRNNFFCAEYYANGSLKDFLIARGHYMNDFTAQSFFRDIVAGMCYLHDQEVFHRDLKTANVLVGSRAGKCPYRLVISDFGLSQDKTRQDCFVRDGSGGTSQYTAPEVLLSTGEDPLNLYKADVYSMALVSWEILSYACCKLNDTAGIREELVEPVPTQRCQIQNHTAFGAYLLNRFPDLSSTSTSSSVVREYMRNMYKSNVHFRPVVPERWPAISPTIKMLVMMTRKMWSTEPSDRLSAAQLARAFNLTRYNSRLSLTSKGSVEARSFSSVLCINSKTLS